MATPQVTKNYRDPKIIVDLAFAGGTDSDGFSCNGIRGDDENIGGNGQIRRIIFPAGWATADITFQVFEDDTFAGAGNTLFVTDCANIGVATIPNCQAVTSVAVPAQCFDSVDYFKIISSVAQTVTIQIVLQSIYQVGV